jgi:chorismate lyase / 3-hydroxybenzoate synthase
MPAPLHASHSTPTVRVEYHAAEMSVADSALAVIGFGDERELPDDPRSLRVDLTPIFGAGQQEVWRGNGMVRTGRAGAIRYACDTEHLFAVLEIDEREHAGIAAAGRAAYSAIRAFQAASRFPHLLRMWNFFGAINSGEGDAERYKQFCVGRAAGFDGVTAERYPAGTAIGRPAGGDTLQVYWLAGRRRGIPIENPRQLSAYRYPRRYGPIPPSFSRAMLITGPTLLISGTASVIGHASQHSGELRAQLAETLTNMRAVIERAAAEAPTLPRDFGAGTVLKVYLRDAANAAALIEFLRECVSPDAGLVVLEGDICRSDLAIEIESVHSGR